MLCHPLIHGLKGYKVWDYGDLSKGVFPFAPNRRPLLKEGLAKAAGWSLS